MDSKVVVEINDTKMHIELSPKAIEAENLQIKYKDIKSLHTKNNGVYFLKIVDTVSTYVLKFTSVKMRDLIKNILISSKAAHEDKDLKIFIQFPPLLKVFEELDVSQTQFLNYYKASFFHNIKNEKNTIDTFLGKRMGFPCNTFASRINNYSLLNMHYQKDIKAAPKAHSESIVDFEPIYPEERSVERKKLSNFDFKDFEGLSFDVELEVEAPKVQTTFEMGELVELRRLRKENKKSDGFLEFIKDKYKSEDLSLLKRIVPRKDSPEEGEVSDIMVDHKNS